jgi:superfamily II DNA or RNA helicase
MEWFRERPKGEEAALVMTRDLGGRGLDFPAAESVLFVSPRSNYRTVAQEIARIRLRAGAVKESTIYFYAGTEEQAKAQRLAAHMQARTFRDANLFELADPPEAVELRDFESRDMAYEESL